jgi:regulator of PEP synthase PpsR (kinase-PPPase family)
LNTKFILILLPEPENQILKILEDAKKNENSVILYTIVDNNLAKYLANVSDKKKIPCFGVLGKFDFKFF